MSADGTLQGRANFLQEHSVEQTLAAARLLLAYELILERTYGIEIGGDVPVIFTTADPATGLDQHFRLQFDWRFVDVELVGPKPPLPEPVRERLQAGTIDADRLRELLPPDRFVLRFAPCGSGGRTYQPDVEGGPPRMEDPFGFGVTNAPHDWSWSW